FPAEAQVLAARQRRPCHEIDAVALLVDVEQRAAELDALDDHAAVDGVGLLDLRAQNLLVKGYGGIEICDGDGDMVETADHGTLSLIWLGGAQCKAKDCQNG